jgi:hypothetical protein
LEPHYVDEAPAPGKNFEAAPALAPTLLYTMATLKQAKVKVRARKMFSPDFF